MVSAAPKPLGHVIVARHGSTKLNRPSGNGDTIRGWLNEPLSAQGRLESKELGRRLCDQPKVLGVFTSDLPRSVETAKLVANECQVPMFKVSALRTWHLGHLEGKTVNRAVVKEIEDAVKSNKPVQGGEPFSQFCHRLLGFLDDVLTTVKGGGLARPGMKQVKALTSSATQDYSIVLITHGRPLQLADLYIRSDASIAHVQREHYHDLVDVPAAVKPGGFIRLSPRGGDWHVSEIWREQPKVEHAKATPS